MRRADRLFQIVQLLRRRKRVTAAQLAERLEVSERTVYRDIRDLARSGLPIQGEAGVGYRLGAHFDLPPLMFTLSEVQALALGTRMVETWADDELRLAARSVLDKVEAVLPPESRRGLLDTALFSISFEETAHVRKQLGTLREAITTRRKVRLRYTGAEGRSTERTLRALGLYFWGKTWTVVGYCELRSDFRSFRVDRIEQLVVSTETFEVVEPITLEDCIRALSSR